MGGNTFILVGSAWREKRCLSSFEYEIGDLSAITGGTSGLGECQVKPLCLAYKPIVHPTPVAPPLPIF